MALVILLAIVGLFAVRALVGWRQGLVLMVVVAAVQDPLRKLVPGTPGWLVLATAPVFLAAVVASMSRTRGWWSDFRRHFPKVGSMIPLFAFLCLPAAVLSATYGEGSWMLTVLGAFSYSLIFLAVITGYHYARSVAQLRKLLAVYCGVHVIALSGAYLEYFGLWHSDVLGSAALGYHWIRWGWGYTVDMVTGFYRSADVMGWHAAAVCMLSMVLAMTGAKGKRAIWVIVAAVALGALLLCGRRKMVYMLPIFAVAITWIYWVAGRQGRTAVILGLFLIPAGSAWLVGDLISEDSANLRYYSGEGLEESVLNRIEVHGFQSLVETYRQSGFFGEGLGVATPGSHNLKVERPRVWQESTGSRILVELGVPGMLGFLGVMLALLGVLWRETVGQVRQKGTKGHYAAGLFAFFLANAGSLVVSGQILADPFIASFLGLLVGMILSISTLQVAPAKPRRRPVAPMHFDFQGEGSH